jgi:hypothetical protein
MCPRKLGAVIFNRPWADQIRLKKMFPGVGCQVAALDQLKRAIVETIDQQGNHAASGNYSTFAYVQRGTHVGIFEYHNVESILDEKGIPHKGGYIPLTQPYHIQDNWRKVGKGDHQTTIRSLTFYTEIPRKGLGCTLHFRHQCSESQVLCV